MILTIVDKLTDPDTLVMLVDAALQLMIALASGLIDALPKLIEKAPEIIMNLVTALIKAAPKILDAAAELIVKLVEGIWNLRQKIIDTGVELVTTIKDGFITQVEKAKQWGKDLVDNFIGGIKEKWENLKQTVSNVANTVKDFLGFSEPEEGPLSNFHTYAPDMMMSFAEGIRKNIGLVTDAVGSVAESVSGDMSMNLRAPAYQVADNTQRTEQNQLAMAGGDITIPVYIGGELIDRIVVNATQRANFRSGGR